MPRVARAADASDELIGTGAVNRNAIPASSSVIGRVSLARLAWSVVAYNIIVIVWGAYLRATSSSLTLLRLRVLHPIAAVIGSIYVLWLVHAFWRKPERFVWVPLLTLTLTGQTALGAMNVILLAPVWLQMTHLLVAEIFWIVLVLASANQLVLRSCSFFGTA